MKNKFLLLLLLAGCTVGPNYKKPETETATTYIEAESTPFDDSELTLWWKQLNDPFLDKLIEEAAVGSFDIAIALEKIHQARAQYRIERAKLWPEIDLDMAAMRQRYSQNLFDSPFLGPPIQNFFQIGFDAVWEVDVFGGLRRAKNAAHDQWQATKEEARGVLIMILSEVASTYVTICALQEEKRIAVNKLKLDEENLLLIEEQFEAGLVDLIHVDAAKSVLDEDKAALMLIVTSLRQSIYALATLLGKQPEAYAAEFDKERPIPKAFGKIPVGLPSDLLRRRPDIRTAERNLAAATEQIGVAVAQLFPSFALTGNNYSYAGDHLNNTLKSASRTWSFGPSIVAPLWDWGLRRAQVAVNTSLQKQAFLQYEKTVVAALQDIEGALVAFFKEQERLTALTDKVEMTKRTYFLTKDLFEAGLYDYPQVIAAKLDLLNAEDEWIGSSQALTTDLIAVYKALGGDWICSKSP